MLITTEGVIIHERFVGENDKYIDVLTKDLGIIEISAKGVKKITSKNSASTQLFAYSKLCVNKSKDRYILNSSEPINVFYNLRLDIEKIALASYFSEIIKYSIVSEEPSEAALRLFLNCLHFLSNGERTQQFIKSVFEFRLLSDIGLMPNFVGCKNCSTYLTKQMYFYINEGYILCSNCFSGLESDNIVLLNEPLLHTLRYIIFSDLEKMFNFKLSFVCQKKLSIITEKYLLSHLNRGFKTLEFYKSL